MRLGRGPPHVSLKSAWREFWHDVPGQRFGHRYERLNTRDHSTLGRVLRMALGIALIALGLVFGPLPGPGFVPTLAGLALLAGESRRIAAALDRAEVKVRSWLS